MSNLELQFWSPKTRTYVRADRATVDRENYPRGWRLVNPSKERTLAPRYIPTGLGAPSRASSRTVETVQREYLAWAIANGRTKIHVYDKHVDRIAAMYFRKGHEQPVFYLGTIVPVDPEEQFRVTESNCEESPGFCDAHHTEPGHVY